MSPNPIVILHGWSDTSASFVSLAAWLTSQGFVVQNIYLGDYLSMNDEITLQDLGFAFRRALTTNNIPQGKHAFDVIVHSTGGLVIREYLRQICEGTPEQSPVQNLLMFSPANFGSPLAAMGKSILGRLLDGWSVAHFMQTGTRILQALELAAPYSWDLAMADLFSPSNVVFNPINTLVTIIGGTAAYPDFRAALHVNGSDGTVLVSTATLNAALLRLDCSAPDPIDAQLEEAAVGRKLALAVLNRDHSATHDPNDVRQQPQWQRTVLDALRLDPTQYDAHVARCDTITQQTFAPPPPVPSFPDRYHQFQIFVVRVRDQFGQPVPDYMLEFYQEDNDASDAVFTEINAGILTKVTTNSVDASYRSFLFDMTDLQAYLTGNPNAQIEMSLSAAPVSERIGYRNPTRGVPVFVGSGATLIRPNTPLLVDIVLYRDPVSGVFQLKPAG